MPVDIAECRRKILSEEYLDIIADYPVRPDRVEAADLCYVDIEDFFQVIYWNRQQVADLNEYFYSHRNLPKLYGLMQEGGGSLRIFGESFDPNSLIASGITQVQREPLSLSGRGCVMVFIDTGIDYTNPVFRKEDGSSRILAIWDQTIQDGQAPEGFLYGSEYTKVEIDRALRSETPYEVVPSRDEKGHGTAVASVAAGSRVDNGFSFLGAAPDADIVVVKLKECKRYLRDFYLLPERVPAYEETDLLLAVQYGDRFARTFLRPVVFCIGVGTSYGDHEGSSALSQYLEAIAARRSRAVVVCGGDEGNADHHFQGAFTDAQNSTTVEVRVGDGSQGFLLQFWGTVPDVFTVSVRSPGGEVVPPIQLGIRQPITYNLVYEDTRITVAGELVEASSGEELVTFRLEEPTPGIWTFEVTGSGAVQNGVFHAWLPITPFLDADVYFLTPSPYVTLTEPAMAGNVIAVSTYQALNNSFFIESGRGFSKNNRPTPALAAPGVDVSTARGRETGSSYAAALTAGAVAQFLQWAVVEDNRDTVNGAGVRNYFVRGADRDADRSYPNREWGYGRLDITGVFDALIGN
jgi:subtilisin family serine protease